jgi:hypothetical protein
LREDSSHPSYCRACQWAAWLRQKYKITLEEFAAKVAEQDGRCPIDGEMLDVSLDAMTGRRKTRVDHDHRTGRFRGITCHRHNIGMGYFADDPALLRAAASYLETA